MNKYSLDDLIKRYPILCNCKNDIFNALVLLEETFLNKSKLLIAGNGGSSSDADHIVGELMKGFVYSRRIDKSFEEKLINIDYESGKELSSVLQTPLPAISLSNHQSLNTAFQNDVENGGDYCFAQQLFGYGKKGDTLLAISTSGNSKNVLYAAIVAKAMGMKVIALTGRNGGKLKKYADISIVVPLNETFMIQEMHLPIYHYLCLSLEEKFFGEKK